MTEDPARPGPGLRNGMVAATLLALLLCVGFLPLARCPSCSEGWCSVEAYFNGEKIPCDVCGDRRRIPPLVKAWMAWKASR